MRILIILMLLLLSGCSTAGRILDAGGEINDSALVAAEATICRAASIGSILRKYDTEEKARAWKELCTQESNDAAEIIIGNRSN